MDPRLNPKQGDRNQARDYNTSVDSRMDDTPANYN